MPLAEAIALVEGNSKSEISNFKSQISIQPHDAIADRQALEELATWCQQFSPILSLEDAPRPESLFLDLTGLAHLFGSETALIERIEQAFAKRHLKIHIAVAKTPGAAWALTHSRSRLSDPPLPIPSLPLPALRLPLETITCLEELGIYRIEQLLQLPRETLSARFGSHLLLRIDQLTGQLPEAIVAHKPPSEFSVEWLLEHATDRQEMIDFVLESLVTRLTQQLAARREGVLRLDCRFDLQPGERLQFSIGLYRASAAPKHLLGLIHLQLEKLRLRAAVSVVRLTALSTAPLAMEQHGLFDEGHNRDAPRHLAALVDRLASRLGRDAVLQPTILADAQPEYACQYLPLVGCSKALRKQRPHRKTDSHPLAVSLPIRPLNLVSPIPLQAIAIAPEGPPIHFRLAGQDQRVMNVWGPERIETGWWRQRGVRRDYYRVETQAGHRLWLFRRLADQRWFWHGTFE